MPEAYGAPLRAYHGLDLAGTGRALNGYRKKAILARPVSAKGESLPPPQRAAGRLGAITGLVVFGAGARTTTSRRASASQQGVAPPTEHASSRRGASGPANRAPVVLALGEQAVARIHLHASRILVRPPRPAFLQKS